MCGPYDELMRKKNHFQMCRIQFVYLKGNLIGKTFLPRNHSMWTSSDLGLLSLSTSVCRNDLKVLSVSRPTRQM